MGEGKISTVGFEILPPQKNLRSSLENGLENLKASSTGFNTSVCIQGLTPSKKDFTHRICTSKHAFQTQ